MVDLEYYHKLVEHKPSRKEFNEMIKTLNDFKLTKEKLEKLLEKINNEIIRLQKAYDIYKKMV